MIKKDLSKIKAFLKKLLQIFFMTSFSTIRGKNWTKMMKVTKQVLDSRVNLMSPKHMVERCNSSEEA